MPNAARIIQLENTLRIIVASTIDDLAKAQALDILDESPEQSRDNLLQTCWRDHASDLREAVTENLRHSSNAAVAALVHEHGK